MCWNAVIFGSQGSVRNSRCPERVVAESSVSEGDAGDLEHQPGVVVWIKWCGFGQFVVAVQKKCSGAVWGTAGELSPRRDLPR